MPDAPATPSAHRGQNQKENTLSTNPVNNAVQGLISQVGNALSGLSPFAKAIVPAASGLVGSFVTMAFTGHYNWANIEVLGVGVVAAVVTYVVPNIEHKSTPPVAPVVTKSAAKKPAA